MSETKMPAGPERILPPPLLPPEKLFKNKRPENIPEADELNPITRRLKKRWDLASFDRLSGGISKEGRQFINQNLFDDLYAVYDRDLGRIQRDIDEAREIYTGFPGRRMLNFLQARLDYQIAWQAAQVEKGEFGAFFMSYEEILAAAETFKGKYSQDVTEENFLLNLKASYDQVLEAAIKKEESLFNGELEKSALESFMVISSSGSKIPGDIPEQNWYKREPKTAPETLRKTKQINIWTERDKKTRKFPLFQRAVLGVGITLLIGAMADATLVEPVVELPQAGDAFSGVADSRAQKLGEASAVKIPRQEIPKTIPKEYYDAAMWAQKETGVPRSVILGIFRQESSMGKDPNLLASKDLGPAQIKASTWQTVKERVGTMVYPEKSNHNNPRHAALAAALVLKDSGFTKDAKRAIRTYHRGLGHWQDNLGKDYYDKVLGYAVSFEESLQQAGF